jgi:hypothetical protein
MCSHYEEDCTVYEPIRHKSVHTMAAPTPPTPRRSRDEELALQLAATFAALLTITDELGTDAELGTALADHVARLQGGRAPLRVTGGSADRPDQVAALHRRAHTLADRALVLAESRQDEPSAALAERVAAHTAATV